MKIIVAGGDGFCGWPTALYLSKRGFEVGIVDNLVRREIDEELNSNSLTPIASLEERVEKWKELTGKDIEVFIGDLNDWTWSFCTFCRTKICSLFYDRQRARYLYSIE